MPAPSTEPLGPTHEFSRLTYSRTATESHTFNTRAPHLPPQRRPLQAHRLRPRDCQGSRRPGSLRASSHRIVEKQQGQACEKVGQEAGMFSTTSILRSLRALPYPWISKDVGVGDTRRKLWLFPELWNCYRVVSKILQPSI
jgi:hypothetical protein